MREIVFDTETTGLDSREDRVIEIGGLELVNRFPSGRTFHVYLNPQGRSVHPEAQAVHGISNADLADKPAFHDIVGEFLEFIDGAKLVAHNATFDMAFVNAELARIGEVPIALDRVVDTLMLARRKHPMGPNSLDALCKRYGVDNSRRTFHGALLDAELLAEVYAELMGGRQAALGLDVIAASEGTAAQTDVDEPFVFARERRPRLTNAEREAHEALVKRLGDQAIWKRIAG
jgi:DNA polymerase-3 subunit epsilon